MKRLILLVLVCGVLFACQEQKQRYFETSPEVETFLSMLDDYEKGNWEAWEVKYADSAQIFYNTWIDGMSPAEAMAQHRETVSALSSYGFMDESFKEMVINSNGDKWVHFWGVWEGTIAANGQKVGAPVHLAAQFVDGKCVLEFGFWDNAPMNQAFMKLAAAAEEAVEESADQE